MSQSISLDCVVDVAYIYDSPPFVPLIAQADKDIIRIIPIDKYVYVLFQNMVSLVFELWLVDPAETFVASINSTEVWITDALAVPRSSAIVFAVVGRSSPTGLVMLIDNKQEQQFNRTSFVCIFDVLLHTWRVPVYDYSDSSLSDVQSTSLLYMYNSNIAWLYCYWSSCDLVLLNPTDASTSWQLMTLEGSVDNLNVVVDMQNDAITLVGLWSGSSLWIDGLQYDQATTMMESSSYATVNPFTYTKYLDPILETQRQQPKFVVCRWWWQI
jgi:hypothetical protein